MRPGWVLFIIGVICVSEGLVSCASLPPPRTVYQDSLTTVQLREERRTDQAYSHPVSVTNEQMIAILSGIRVQKRGEIIMNIVTGDPEAEPVFQQSEIQAMAPKLSQALSMATPKEIVTFYRRISDPNIGVIITSGGLFVNEQHVYFILANHRNRPSDVMSQAVSYEVDPMDDPLFSLRARSFGVTFVPGEVQVKQDTKRVRYEDPGKVVILDLQRLKSQLHSAR